MTMTTETQLTEEQKKTLRHVARLIVTGSRGRTQMKGRYFPKDHSGEDADACCVIGACLIAEGAPQINSVVLGEWLPLHNWPQINYPDNTPAWSRWNDGIYNANGIKRYKYAMNLVDVLMQLNDVGDWTFKQIADYLRGVAQKGVVITITE